jgi:hypothetical protein
MVEKIPFTLEEGQIITDFIAAIIDPKHKYKIKKYKRTCAFTRDTFMYGKHRIIGVSHATLTNRSVNGFIRVMLHEITHFMHDQRYARRPDLLVKRRAHRKTFRDLEQKVKAKFEAVYGEVLPEHCWEA